MRVFVAGATGVAGKEAVRHLVSAGHVVTGVARSAEKALLLERFGARPVAVDLFEATAVKRVISRHEAVVNVTTHIPPFSRAAIPGSWRENDDIRREVSRNLVDAALASGATRYIQESIAFAYEDRGDEWIDEDTPLDLVRLTESLAVAEDRAARITAKGATGIVLRFGQFYAPHASHTIGLVETARRGIFPLPGRPEEYVPTIHHEDIGSAVVVALAAPAGAYNVVDDDPLTKRALSDVLARSVGRERLHHLSASALELGPSGRLYVRSNRSSNRRFRAVTNWRPRYSSARDGMPAVVDEMTRQATADGVT
ncbi:MAG TPA: NAD(P)H-binding protein [Acidimicrobiales bacterium]|nr:NAD(P)H-binding protein [Acidimicrobiales bacterium]